MASSTNDISGPEWELLLTKHYLLSDGPSGSAPLTFLDATPAELCKAVINFGRDPSGVFDAFIKHFSRWEVEYTLSGQAPLPKNQAGTPGYFRFLVLTCAIANDAADHTPETNNFRVRLGELLGTGRPFNAVGGVNRLWGALRQWAERRRSEGEAFREIRLPNPGSMTLIGYAVRLAFPSWRDKVVFEKCLRAVPFWMLARPQQLIEELNRPHRFSRIPGAIREAMEDFAQELRAGRTLLSGHRFWTLVSGIADDIAAAGLTKHQPSWRFTVWFGGYDQDAPDFLLETSQTKSFSEPTVAVRSSSFHEVLAAVAGGHIGTLRTKLASGRLVLCDAGGSWVLESKERTDTDRVLIFVNPSKWAQWRTINTNWTTLGEGWNYSRPLDPNQLPRDLRTSVQLREISLVGGLRTGRTTYLGQPMFLPSISAPAASTITLVAQTGTEAGLVVENGADPHFLTAPNPIQGSWRAIVDEGNLRSELLLHLERSAPELSDFTSLDLARWEPECDIEPLPEVAAKNTSRFQAVRSAGQGEPWEQIVEAIYTKARSGWSEGELVEALAPALPDRRMAWDVIRAFAEATWLDPFISTSWRGRRWMLRRPTLNSYGPSECVIDGATGRVAVDRLSRAVASLGGTLEVRQSLAPHSPPTIVARDVELSALSRTMDWPVLQSMAFQESAGRTMRVNPTPRTTGGRQIAGRWNFSTATFIPPTMRADDIAGVTLDRWSTERADDHDIYVIEEKGETKSTLSRTAAILEAHRLAKVPLFEIREGRLVRLRLGGNLPLQVSRSLRVLHGVNAGAVTTERGWSYAYACDARSAHYLGTVIGDALAGHSARLPNTFRHYAEMKRRRTNRTASWITMSRRVPK
jgi:hypothetical protein